MAGLGHRVGPFDLIERIASGRRTSLYHAVRPDSSRPPNAAAVRMADDLEDADAVGQIEREYAVLRALSDARFPEVIGHYAVQAALAVAWIEGVTLTDVVQARADGLVELNPATALDILTELSAGLRHAHSRPSRKLYAEVRRLPCPA